MKPIHLLPPAAALVASGVWLGLQERSISVTDQQTTLLRDHIAAAHATTAGISGETVAANASGKAAEEKDGIDWEELAKAMAKSQRGGMPDIRAMMKLQTRLMEMDAAGLEAALDEIAALDLDLEARRGLEGMLISALAQKDPKLVLDRFFDRMSDADGMTGWHLAHAFQQWAGKSGPEAVAWLDARIAEGKFESKSLDGKSGPRIQFEAAAVAALLASDPDAASRRIAGLPVDQRLEIFQHGMLMNLKPGSEKAYATLVRENLPETQHGTAYAHTTSMMMHQGGYEKVGGFLDSIDATPGERQQVAAQAAMNKIQQLTHQGKVNRAAVDEMRGWLKAQAPDEVDRMTGEALGNVWQENRWKESAKLIDELHAENPGDDLLVSFLSGHQARQSSQAAKDMAAKISDPAKREEVLARIEGRPVPSPTTDE